MALILQDTNILLRGSQRAHAQHQETLDAQAILRNLGDRLCVVAQNLVEFRAVGTRPVSGNGLGMDQLQVDGEIARLENLFPAYLDVPEILAEWKRLTSVYGAAGKQNHDARLVAAMNVHGIATILTFNKSDFIRYPGITAWEPKDLLLPSS